MKENGTVFDDEQFANPYPDGIQHHYWTVARNRIVDRIVKRLWRNASDGVVLDIGCGRGITVNYLRQQGVNAIGCELGSPEPILPEVAPFLKLACDAFELKEDFRNSCKQLLLLDVLEHLPDPQQFLSQCFTSFPNVSHILVTVPARMELWTNYDEYYEHFTRYDIPSLQSIGPEDSCNVTNAGYFFHGLYLPAWLLTLFDKERQITIHPPSRALRPVHRFLGWCFSWEQRILPKRLAGTSLMGVFQRTLEIHET